MNPNFWSGLMPDASGAPSSSPSLFGQSDCPPPGALGPKSSDLMDERFGRHLSRPSVHSSTHIFPAAKQREADRPSHNWSEDMRTAQNERVNVDANFALEMTKILVEKISQFNNWLKYGGGGHGEALNSLNIGKGAVNNRSGDGNPERMTWQECFRINDKPQERNGNRIKKGIVIEFYTRELSHDGTIYRPLTCFHISIFYIVDADTGRPIRDQNNNFHYTSDILGNTRLYTNDSLFTPPGGQLTVPTGVNRARVAEMHASDIFRQLIEDMVYYGAYGHTISNQRLLTERDTLYQMLSGAQDDTHGPVGRTKWTNDATRNRAQEVARTYLIRSLRAFAKLWMIYCAERSKHEGHPRDELNDFNWQMMEDRYLMLSLDDTVNRGVRHRGAGGVSVKLLNKIKR